MLTSLTRSILPVRAGLRAARLPSLTPARIAAPRLLQTSAVARASEDPSGKMDSSLPPGMEKIGESPGAMAAIRNLMDVLKTHGMDLSSGEKPSMMMLAKLAMKSDVREATSKGAWPTDV